MLMYYTYDWQSNQKKTRLPSFSTIESTKTISFSLLAIFYSVTGSEGVCSAGASVAAGVSLNGVAASGATGRVAWST